MKIILSNILHKDPKLVFETVSFVFDHVIFSISNKIKIISPKITKEWQNKEIDWKELNKSEIVLIPEYIDNCLNIIVLDKKNKSIIFFRINEIKRSKLIKKLTDKYTNLKLKTIPVKLEKKYNHFMHMILLCFHIIENPKKIVSRSVEKDYEEEYYKNLRKELWECFLRIYPQHIENVTTCKPIQDYINNSYMYGKFSKNNYVEFIVGAEKFFGKINAKLGEISKMSIKPNTYVRMAFWTANPDLQLVPNGDNKTILKNMLLDIASKGCKVKVILWKPKGIEANFNPALAKAVLKENKKFEEMLNKKGKGNIEVYLEEHSKSMGIGYSIHQKIVIFSINGKLEVVIGGMNLDKWYYSVHDTAILIKGPGAFHVEQEWLRRWKKKSSIELPFGHLIHQKIIGSHLELTDINIATTNSELSFKILDIRMLMKEKIGKAKKYIYLENFVLSDPEIVTAIAERKKEVPNLKIIVMLTHPDILYDDYIHLNYLSYFSFLKLTLLDCKSVTYDFKSVGYTLKRKECIMWNPKIYYNGWLRDSKLKLKRKLSSKEGYIPFLKITNITTTEPCFFTLYKSGKKHYIHSKLMLIDDMVAVIGSANFSYRSMDYDGEISAFILGKRVENIRVKLLESFGVFSPKDDWYKYFEKISNEIKVLSIGDFKKSKDNFKPKNTKNFFSNYTWY